MNAPVHHSHFAPAGSSADYDAWLVKEVREALDDPRPLVSHAEALRRSAVRREALLKRQSLLAA